MKRIFSVLLVLCMLVSTSAMAETLTFTTKSGTYANGGKTLLKNSGIGVDAQVNVSANAGSHSMYYQIRKASGLQCTEPGISAGSVSLIYKNDGYGQSLGRTGYSYKLRVAHRSQCKCTSGKASVTFTWEP